MLKNRLAVLTVTALVISGAAIAVPSVVTGGAAGASSTSHKLTHIDNISTSVENAVKISLKCSSATGVYSLKVTNIDLVDPSGGSFGEGGDLSIVADFHSSSLSDVMATMRQSASNGLWQVNSAGVLDSPDSCASGVSVELYDDADSAVEPSPFDFEGVLT